MPKIGETIVSNKKEQVHHVTREYGRIRYKCPVCKSVHWWASKTGCHKLGCGYKGNLEII